MKYLHLLLSAIVAVSTSTGIAGSNAIEERESSSDAIVLVKPTTIHYSRRAGKVAYRIEFRASPTIFKGSDLASPINMDVTAAHLDEAGDIQPSVDQYLLLFLKRSSDGRYIYVPSDGDQGGLFFTLSDGSRFSDLRKFLLSQLASADAGNVSGALKVVTRTKNPELLSAVKGLASGTANHKLAQLANDLVESSEKVAKFPESHFPDDALIAESLTQFSAWLRFFNAANWGELFALYAADSDDASSWRKGGKAREDILDRLRRLQSYGTLTIVQSEAPEKIPGELLRTYVCAAGSQTTVKVTAAFVRDTHGRAKIASVRWPSPTTKTGE
jgi:hypothetical protein